jgi:putative DNA primase/helicase
LSTKKSISNISFLEGVNRYYCGFPIDKNFESLLNAKPNELPIKNKKIIDLKTKLVRERTKDDKFSFELNIDYIQSCDYTNVIQFFNDICLQDQDLVDYLKRFFGYAMTGEISDRSLHIFWGNGKNGKSTIMDIFKRIIGKKFFVTTSERVMLKSISTSATSPEVIRIKDARTIVLNETGKEEELNAERIKALTGGDEISARQLYSAQIEFNPKSTPIMLTNNKPKFDIHDQAMIDRIKLVPFLARFENNPENRDYINELMTDHLDEFFSWFVDGASEWYQGKSLIPCKVMQFEMQNYINELDIIGQFINERIEIVTKEKYALTAKLEKSQSRTKKELLYGLFIGFSEEQGVRVKISKTEFHKEILKINIELIKSDGLWYYLCKEKKNTDFGEE